MYDGGPRAPQPDRKVPEQTKKPGGAEACQRRAERRQCERAAAAVISEIDTVAMTRLGAWSDASWPDYAKHTAIRAERQERNREHTTRLGESYVEKKGADAMRFPGLQDVEALPDEVFDEHNPRPSRARRRWFSSHSA